MCSGIGAIIGAYVWGWLADRVGRRIETRGKSIEQIDKELLDKADLAAAAARLRRA
jgi:MFS family permease